MKELMLEETAREKVNLGQRDPLPPPPRRWQRPVLALTLTLVIVAVGLRWAHHRATTLSAAHAFVRGDSVHIGAPLDGQVVAVAVRTGQTVKAGDVLVRLEDSRQRVRLAEARAALDRARLEVLTERENLLVDRQRVGVMSSRLQANHSLGLAEERAADIEAAYARRMAERAEALAAKQMGPRADEEDAAALAEMAGERLERARSRALAAKAETRSADVERSAIGARAKRLSLLEASLETPQAALTAAEEELKLTVLRAPSAGRVSRRLVEPGSAVRVGAPLIELQIGDGLRVEAWMNESDLSHLGQATKVKIRFDALPGQVLDGRIQAVTVVTEADVRTASSLATTANKLPSGRFLAAHIEILERDARLIPGLSARVEIPR